MMPDVSSSKWLFVLIGDHKVFKLYNYEARFYKIVRVEPEMTWAQRQQCKWCPSFVIYEIPEKEYLDILYKMKELGYSPYLNQYNARIVRYLNRHYFSSINSATCGFDLYILIKKAQKQLHYSWTLYLEED